MPVLTSRTFRSPSHAEYAPCASRQNLILALKASRSDAFRQLEPHPILVRYRALTSFPLSAWFESGSCDGYFDFFDVPSSAVQTGRNLKQCLLRIRLLHSTESEEHKLPWRAPRNKHHIQNRSTCFEFSWWKKLLSVVQFIATHASEPARESN